MNTDTPRSQALHDLIVPKEGPVYCYDQMLVHARQLERELNAAKALLSRCAPLDIEERIEFSRRADIIEADKFTIEGPRAHRGGEGMNLRLKVYGWRDFRRECPPAPNGSRQTREIMAARSKAEVKRMFPRVPMSEITETGNKLEVTTALAKPGAVFWRSLNCYSDKQPFTEATP